MPSLPLGERLVQSRRIQRSGLLEALAYQRREGGSLGTCLLESGALSEAELVIALTEQYGAPAASIRDLLHPEVDAVQGLPAETARDLRAVPFRLEPRRRLHIAVANAADLRRGDDLAFAAGLPVKLWVTTEVRLAQALERAYGEECPARLRRLADRLDHAAPLEDRTDLPAGGEVPGAGSSLDLDSWTLPELGLPELTSNLAPSSDPTPASNSTDPRNSTGNVDEAHAADTSGATLKAIEQTWATSSSQGVQQAPPRMSAEEEEDASTAEVPAMPSSPASPTSPRPQSAAASQDAGADSGATIGRRVLDELLQGWRRVALLAVRRGQVEGWLGDGDGYQASRLANFRVSLSSPSLFLSFSQGAEVYTGSLTPMPPHRELMHCWDRELADTCAAAAVRLGPRLVAVLFAEGPRTPIVGAPPRARESLRRLGKKTGKAFERLILEETVESFEGS